MSFTAQDVKALRERTGAGMLNCKKALMATNGDVEAAIDWLREKGIAKAAKKSARVTSEGLISVITNGTCGAVVEVNSETDFVARNEDFQNFVAAIGQTALDNASDDLTAESLATQTISGGAKSVADTLTDKIATIGENMTLRRAQTLSVSQGCIAAYVHNKTTDTLGKIGVLVALESSADAAALSGLGKQLAMHIAAAKPLALTRDGIDGSHLEREKQVLTEQARNEGKPDNIIEKMVTGRINKFYQESVLLEQTFVIDGETKIADVVANAAKEHGTDITLSGYVCFRLGEGIEKKTEDFAEEVKKAASGS